jgi:hypothetical protein
MQLWFLYTAQLLATIAGFDMYASSAAQLILISFGETELLSAVLTEQQ